MEYAAIVAAIASIIGALFSAGKEGDAKALRERMAAEYGDEILPELDKAIAQEAGPSALASLTEAPEGRAAQLDVMGELGDIYDSAGNTMADQAAYDAARRGVSQRASSMSQNAAIDAARRGQTGTGLAPILAASAQQGELEALAGLNADIASDARGRALQALMSRGGMASNLRAADWGVQRDKATAVDTMNRFNASQRQQAELYNVGLPQQDFDNRLALLRQKHGIQEGVAQGDERSGAAARQTAAGVGNSALSYGQAWDWNEKEKDK